MKVGKIKTMLLELWKAEESSPTKTSVLLLGPPGVGKSTVVREAAEAYASQLGLRFVEYSDDIALRVLKNPQDYFVFVDLRLTEIEAADLSGIPRDIDGAVMYKPLLWARVLSKARGVLFLDELTNENDPNKLAAAYKVILDRAAGFVKFSDDVFIVAAGNSPEHSAVANQLPAPLVNRLLVIEAFAPTINEWRDWMTEKYGDGWDIRTYAFLKAFEADNYLLRAPEDPETLQNYPTPRSWTKLALMLNRGFEDPEIINGLVGPDVGTRFRAFITSRVNLDELLENPKMFKELNIDKRYMAALMLASRLEKNHKTKGAHELLRAMSDISPEYVMVTLLFMKSEARKRVLADIFSYLPNIANQLIDIAAISGQVRK